MKNWIYSEKKIIKSKHKYYCLQVGIYDKKDEQTHIFNSTIRLSRRLDHAGLTLDLEILNFYFLFSIYDHRHWDEERDTWEV